MANTLSPYMVDQLLDHYINDRLPKAKDENERHYILWEIQVLKNQKPVR